MQLDISQRKHWYRTVKGETMKMLTMLLLLVPISLFAQETGWPDLSTFKSVSGRVANETDIASHSAVFVLKSDGKYIGTPISITLPQYAIYTDAETNKKHQVVIVQAESAKGMNMYGAIDIHSGKGVVSLDTDFELLGKNPHKPAITAK